MYTTLNKSLKTGILKVKKGVNAMLQDSKDMPKIKIITDCSIRRLNEIYTKEYHLKAFKQIAESLNGAAGK